MVFEVDHVIETREFPQGVTRCRHGRLLTAKPRLIPGEVHLLPLNEVCQNIFDRPSAARDARASHPASWYERKSLVQEVSFRVDFFEKVFPGKSSAHFVVPGNVRSWVGVGSGAEIVRFVFYAAGCARWHVPATARGSQDPTASVSERP